MNREQNIDRLLDFLAQERGLESPSPHDRLEKRIFLRALMNTRPPLPLPPDILALQDGELSAQLAEKGVVEVADLPKVPGQPGLRLWQGDITRLHVDAIVNAANSRMLGCFIPGHNCIDNVIHSAAGMQLREECESQMRARGSEEPVGHARITRAYNLPSAWVIHTVGPMVEGSRPTALDRDALSSCYASCLRLAEDSGLKSIAFCCISTGVFRFPQESAARIAIASVLAHLDSSPASSLQTVVFNVFKDSDHSIYKRLLDMEKA